MWGDLAHAPEGEMVELQWYPPGGSEGDKASAPFLQDLSDPARRRGSWETKTKLGDLERAVDSLRRTYGSLREGDSAEAWLVLAATVRLHAGLNRALSDSGLNGLTQAWETCHRELSGRQEPDDEGFSRLKLYAERFPDMASRFPGYGLEGVRIVVAPVFTNLDPIQAEELNQLEIIKSWVQGGAAQTRTIRRAVYDGLHNAFRGVLYRQGEQLQRSTWGVRAHCSASTWIYEALSRKWRGGYPAALCAADDCRELFPKADARATYCSPACVERARRHRAN